MMARWLIWGLLLGAVGCGVRPAMAHEPSLAQLDLQEIRPGAYLGRWTLSSSDGRPEARPDFPPQCVWQPPQLDCGPSGLNGPVAFADIGRSQSALMIRVQPLDGPKITTLLTAAHPTANIRSTPRHGWRDWSDLIVTDMRLGVEHILQGPDHLLFVLGLVVIVGWRTRLLKTITAFTVAHSLTLGAATFGLFTPPVAAVNAAVALSILFIAPEMLRAARGENSLTTERPYVVAFAFGLLHGMGFASALIDAGLPHAELPYALLGFNVGVEIGQMLFILFAALVMRAFRQLAVSLPRWAEASPAYAVGSLGAFWTIGRCAIILGG